MAKKKKKEKDKKEKPDIGQAISGVASFRIGEQAPVPPPPEAATPKSNR